MAELSPVERSRARAQINVKLIANCRRRELEREQINKALARIADSYIEDDEQLEELAKVNRPNAGSLSGS